MFENIRRKFASNLLFQILRQAMSALSYRSRGSKVNTKLAHPSSQLSCASRYPLGLPPTMVP